MPQALVQARSEGDRCVTYNNPTLGLASQGDCKLASPQSRSQSALSWGSRPPAWISSDLGRRPAHPHQLTRPTQAPFSHYLWPPQARGAGLLSPRAPYPTAAVWWPYCSTSSAAAATSGLLDTAPAQYAARVNSRGPRGQLLRMRKHKVLPSLPPLPPNTNPI